MEFTVDEADSIGDIIESTAGLPAKPVLGDVEGDSLGEAALETEKPKGPNFAPRKEYDLSGEEAEEAAKKAAEESYTGAAVYRGMTDILTKNGIFTSDVDLDTIKSKEDFTSAIEAEVTSRLDQEHKELREYRDKGLDVSAMSKITRALEDTRAITPDMLSRDEHYTKEVIRQEYDRKGLDGARMVSLFEKEGSLQEEGEKALALRAEFLEQLSEREIAKGAAEKQSVLDKEAKELKEFETAMGAKEAFGRKVTPVLQEKIKKLVNTTVAYTEDKQPMNAIMKYRHENRSDFEYKMAYLFQVTKGFTDLSSFDNSAESRMTQKFKDAVQTMSSNSDYTGANRTSKDEPVIVDMSTIDSIG